MTTEPGLENTGCLIECRGDQHLGLPELCATQNAIFEHAGRAIILTNSEGTIIYFNRAAQRMLGYSWDEVTHKASPTLFHCADEVSRQATALSEKLQRPVAAGFEVFISDLDADSRSDRDWTYVHKDGTRFPVNLSVSALQDSSGKVFGYLGIASDISERCRMEQDLRIAAIAFESQAAIMVTDARQSILRVNKAFSELTGYAPEEAIGRTPSLLKSGRQGAEFYLSMWNSLIQSGHWEGEIWNRRKNGEIFPEWLTISAVPDAQGNIVNYVSTFSDISNLKVAESEIHHLAFYDPLTTLPNRRLLLNRLDKAGAAGKRNGQYGALLMIDIDHFKTLNDTLGHDVGDRFLLEVANRLRLSVREGDTAARLGGDEFVVMLENLGTDLEWAGVQAETVAEKMRTILSEPYFLHGDTEYFRSASIGISLFCGQEKAADVLLKQADIALYKAKDAGRNAIRFFDTAMQTALDERATLEADLRRALSRGEFVLYVQPQVDTGRRLIGVETLLRWQPTGKPLVAPGDFIPLAEETGLIVPIGLWVLDLACANLARWADDERTRGLTMAVNVSARQFRQAEFVLQVSDALARHGANPRRLKLELTESLLLDNVDEVVAKMQALREIGVRFSLDDFGTGYASLAYLKRYPFEQLKIDRSFVRDITSDAEAAAIVRAVIAMGDTLRLGVVAEGVEENTQYAYLAAHGCRSFQGYLFGKPMSFSAFESKLDLHAAPAPDLADNWDI